MAIFDCLLVLIFIASGLYPLIILIPLPIMGYFAGRNLSRCLLIAYMIFIILMIIFRAILVLVIDYVLFTILTIFVIIMEIVFFGYCIKLFKLLRTISEDERLHLYYIITNKYEQERQNLPIQQNV